MRVGIDATPLLGRMTGVGTYASNLLYALAGRHPEDELVATAFTMRGLAALPDVVPAKVMVHARPVPVRGLRAAWAWSEWPSVQLLCGRVDVFHATNFVLPPTGSAAGVLTVHDLGYLTVPETVDAASLAYRELVPLGLARAAVVLTPSEAVAQQVRDAYAVAPDRIVVTPLGVKAAWATARPPTLNWRLAHGVPGAYLLAVGTLEPRKNLQLLVSAHAALTARGADVPPLVIAGGPGWGEALRLTDARQGSVVMTGHLPVAELRSLVAGATALVFPSLDEGFGLPPLEALACGVPVVANDLPVTKEVLGDEATFCDATDLDALGDGLLRVLDDPAGTPESRRAHTVGFTWERCAELTHDAYVRAAASA